MTDRLGSVRANGDGQRSNYYPYGQEMQATPDGRTKFATYYRDTPGLDYADQRYYANAGGRFLTPDPGGLSTADPSDPGSWNMYAYVKGDPVNSTDLSNSVRSCGRTASRGRTTETNDSIYSCSDIPAIGGPRSGR